MLSSANYGSVAPVYHGGLGGLGGPSMNSGPTPPPVVNNFEQSKLTASDSQQQIRRGDISGDTCLSVDISECRSFACIWHESDCKTEQIKYFDGNAEKTFFPSKFPLENDDDRYISCFSSIFTQWFSQYQKTINFSKYAKKTKKRSFNVAIPGYFSQRQRSLVIKAAKKSSFGIKNIFSRGLAAVAGCLQDSKIFLPPQSEESDLVVLVLIISSEGSVDISFVRLEKCKGSFINTCGFERLKALAVGGKYEFRQSSSTDAVAAECLELMQTGSVNASRICSCLFSGLSAEFAAKVVNKLTDKHIQLFKLQEDDISVGCCLLCAAELDSSKQYLPINDSWTIGFMLPFAEDILTSKFILQEKLSESNDERTLFSPHCLSLPRNVGPARMRGAPQPLPKMTLPFKSSCTDCEKSFPQLTLLEVTYNTATDASVVKVFFYKLFLKNF